MQTLEFCGRLANVCLCEVGVLPTSFRQRGMPSRGRSISRASAASVCMCVVHARFSRPPGVALPATETPFFCGACIASMFD